MQAEEFNTKFHHRVIRTLPANVCMRPLLIDHIYQTRSDHLQLFGVLQIPH